MDQQTEKIIRAIMICKQAHPELRVGQIMLNSIPEGYEKNVFYHSDSEFARWILEFSERYTETKGK